MDEMIGPITNSKRLPEVLELNGGYLLLRAKEIPARHPRLFFASNRKL